MSCRRSRQSIGDLNPRSPRNKYLSNKTLFRAHRSMGNQTQALTRLFGLLKPQLHHDTSFREQTKTTISGEIYLISWLVSISSMRSTSGYIWEYRCRARQLLIHVQFRGSLLTFSPNLNSQSSPIHDTTALNSVSSAERQRKEREKSLGFFFKCVKLRSGTDRVLRARHSSKSISTRATGNTGADPSSKSRLPTPRSSSLFVWKTTNPHGRRVEMF